MEARPRYRWRRARSTDGGAPALAMEAPTQLMQARPLKRRRCAVPPLLAARSGRFFHQSNDLRELVAFPTSCRGWSRSASSQPTTRFWGRRRAPSQLLPFLFLRTPPFPPFPISSPRCPLIYRPRAFYATH
ncbi:hypothetical protein K523DRAFT_359277 [Schizophyllum commune Tattone D]|nr:hypothetical protein K523DRAFT_359277 [Schizophyllum commune Tattone D]